MKEAELVAGLSRASIWRLAKAGRFSVFRSGRDKRIRLVRRSDIEALWLPEPTDASINGRDVE